MNSTLIITYVIMCILFIGVYLAVKQVLTQPEWKPLWRIPKPAGSWTSTQKGDRLSLTHLEESIRNGRFARLKGFVFKGVGWYPDHHVLLLRSNEQNQEPTYELHFYDVDPRKAFFDLSHVRVWK
jgi:hypothetical protein